ncbi:DUF6301 family protein [Cellulomonas xiejunii]|nr:DUF6301 family protein [Cellulomonas xiejunii]MCC2319560.1 DUF6301 family protein [Cellulomonas xiejunii]
MRTAAPEQITAMLVVFETVPWPAGKDVAGALADALGWTVRADLPNGVHYVTALETNDRRADVLIEPDGAGGGTIVALTVQVSDRVADAPADLDQAYRSVVATVEDRLGTPVRADSWTNPRTVWDLATGGRIAVQRLNAGVSLVLLSQRGADLEREEDRLGIDPNRVPGTGHEGL